MQKKLRIAAITIIMASLLEFPSVAQGNSEDLGPGRPSGNQQGPERPDRPKPTESELSLLRLKGLIDNAQTQPELTISAKQAAAILPILQKWQTTIKSNPYAKTGDYVAAIGAKLTVEQNAYSPQPPVMSGGGGPSGNNASSGRKPPQGGPGKIEISSLLTELIENLSLLVSE